MPGEHGGEGGYRPETRRLLSLAELADKARDRARDNAISYPRAAAAVARENKASLTALGFRVTTKEEMAVAIRAITSELGGRGGRAAHATMRGDSGQRTPETDAERARRRVYEHLASEAKRAGHDTVDEMEEALRE